MSYIGDFAVGETIYTKFTTVSTTGAPTVLAGVPAVSVYEDDSITEITAGVTLTIDFDARVGLNHLTLVATGVNGYESGKQYQAVITTGTVGGTSVVGYVVAEFGIEAGVALRPVTAGRTLVVDAAGLADANIVKVGPTGLGTVQTAGDIMADTNDIQTRLPAALVGGRMDSSVGNMAGNVLTAAAMAADVVTELRSTVSGTADSGTTTTMVDAARTEADVDYWKGALLLFTSGTINGQCRLVTAFDPVTDTITFAPATTQAVVTQTYEMIHAGRADLQLWLGVVGNALISGRVDVNTQAMGADVITATAIATDAIGATELATAAANKIRDTILTDATAFPGARIDAAITTRLAPTVAARTLDVSLGGEAGLDWANIGSPATVQNLSATNIDVDQVVASVSGAVGSVTSAVALTAAERNAIADAAFIRAMVEAYSADGAAPTLAQALFELLALLGEFSITGTTITVKKRDGTTTAFTSTLDDATTPTSRTRAT